MDSDGRPHFIVCGQPVSPEKAELARRLRREMTQPECLLWARLRGNLLDGFHFRRQQVIAGFVADFYCHQAALAVEVDGQTHDPDYDRSRDEVFAGKGIKVLRFPNAAVSKDPEGVLSIILQECRSRSAGPTP